MEVDEDEEVSEKEESGDEENVAPKKSNGKGKERAVESDDESEEEEEVVEVDDEESADEAAGPTKKRKQKERIISADEVRAHLRLLFLTETEIIPLLYAPHGPLATAKISGPSTSSRPTASADIFFMEVISVPPTRFRPAATMGDQVFENPQNSLLNAILRQTFTIRDLNRDLAAAQNVVVEINPQGVVTGKPPIDKTRLYTMLLESLVGLQVAVNSHIDSGKNPTIMRGGKLPPMGVKQMLEKKEGLFRMNMMVSFAPFATSTVTDSRPTGETSQLRRTISHFARRQHRNERNRNSTSLRSNAYLPGARHGAQHRQAPTGCHQWAVGAPWSLLCADGRWTFDFSRSSILPPSFARRADRSLRVGANVKGGTYRPRQQAARPRLFRRNVSTRSTRLWTSENTNAANQSQGLPTSGGWRHRHSQSTADSPQAVDDVSSSQSSQRREDDSNALRQLVHRIVSLSRCIVLTLCVAVTRTTPISTEMR